MLYDSVAQQREVQQRDMRWKSHKKLSAELKL